MFDFGFSEILLIFVLALVVLGPEKLPAVVRRVGRWVGRARAMARQFQEQLEEEIDLDGRPRPLPPDPPVFTEPAAEAGAGEPVPPAARDEPPGAARPLEPAAAAEPAHSAHPGAAGAADAPAEVTSDSPGAHEPRA